MESSISKMFGGIPDVGGPSTCRVWDHEKNFKDLPHRWCTSLGLVLHGSLKVLGSRARNRTSSRMGSGTDDGHMVWLISQQKDPRDHGPKLFMIYNLYMFILESHWISFWDIVSHTLMFRHSSQTATSMVSLDAGVTFNFNDTSPNRGFVCQVFEMKSDPIVTIQISIPYRWHTHNSQDTPMENTRQAYDIWYNTSAFYVRFHAYDGILHNVRLD